MEMGIWGGSFIPIHGVVIHSGAGEFGDFFDPRKYHRNCCPQMWPSKWGGTRLFTLGTLVLLLLAGLPSP